MQISQNLHFYFKRNCYKMRVGACSFYIYPGEWLFWVFFNIEGFMEGEEYDFKCSIAKHD